MKIKKLQQRISDLVAEGRDILLVAEREGNRPLTEDEEKRFKAIESDIEETKKTLGLEQTQRDREQTIREVLSGRPIEYPARRVEPASPVNPASMTWGGGGSPWKSFGEFLAAVAEAGRDGGRIDQRLLGPQAAASGLSEGIASDGGFLVQTEFASELLRRTYELGAISSRVRRIPIGPNANGLKINALAESSRASGSRWGGVTAYWQSEAAEKSATKPEFREMELKLKKLTGLCYATDEVLQDASALEGIIQEAFPQEINFKVEDAVINGTGAGMPLGILNGGSLVTVAKEGGQVAATIVYDNIVKMWSRLWARSQPASVWLVNQDTLPQLYSMGITVGVGGAPAFMPPGGLSQSPYATLFGRPIIPVEYCSTLGTVGDIILADLGQYLMIDKGGIQSASSIHVRFVYDETTFRFVYRCDGQPTWNSVLTPASGSGNTLSPFIVLATRS